MRALPRVRGRRHEYVLDERCRELRRVDLPWLTIRLNDFELAYVQRTGRWWED